MDAITLNDWEYEFFGKRTATLTLDGALPDPEKIDSFCREHNVELLQCCVETNDNDTIYAMESMGFEFVDLKVDMAAYLTETPEVPENPDIRLSSEADLPALLPIGHRSFTAVSRWNWQGMFAAEQIDAFYDLWLSNGVRGLHDDFCFQYMRDHEILGFNTLRICGDEVYVGLMSVNPKFRGQGIGDALVRNALRYARVNGYPIISTSTQGRNLTTQKIFMKHGMTIRQMESWYYKKF